MNHRNRRQSGFTLLELILALGMVAMLSLTLYMGLTVTVRAKERAFAAVAPVRTALLAADLVRQDLESVLPCKQLLAGPFIGTSQNGADVLDFYCLGSDVGWHAAPVAQQGLTPAQGGDVPWSEGPRHVVLYLDTSTQPASLIRSVTRNLLAPTVPPPDEEILCRSVRSFTVRYYDGTDWQDSWDSTTLGDILPQAVELTFEAVIDDQPKPGQQPIVYKVTRVFPLACATPPTATGTGEHAGEYAMMTSTNSRLRHRRRRGTILIVTMFIVFTLASLVLVMGASMRVEGMAAANMTASLQASSVERGAEQYVIALLTEQKDTLSDLTEDYFAAVQVGDGYFWIVRPDFGDDNLPVFGLTEENAKLNLNTASYESLMRLPNMTDDVASAIIDWRGGTAGGSSGSASSGSGSQGSYYDALPDPYRSKQAPFETVEEMLLVQGASRQLLYGAGDAAPLGTGSNGRSNIGSGTVSDLQTANGIYDLVTVYSSEKGGTQQVNINDPSKRNDLRDLLNKQLNDKTRADAIVAGIGRGSYKDVFDFYLNNAPKLKPDEFSAIYDSITAKPVTASPIGGGGAAGGGAGGAAGGAAAAAVKGRINVNTAPRDVLLTLPGLEDSDVDRMISQRQGAAAGDTSVAWVADALDKKAIGLGDRITGKSYQYSADIVAVSGNGRAYKRCRIVVNAAGTTPQIVYRRDLTDRGWPMDPEILASLRSGQGQQSWAGARGAMSGGSLR